MLLLCVRLKLFRRRFVPLLEPNLYLVVGYLLGLLSASLLEVMYILALV